MTRLLQSLERYFGEKKENTFGETDWSKRSKRLEKYLRVAIAKNVIMNEVF